MIHSVARQFLLQQAEPFRVGQEVLQTAIEHLGGVSGARHQQQIGFRDEFFEIQRFAAFTAIGDHVLKTVGTRFAGEASGNHFAQKSEDKLPMGHEVGPRVVSVSGFSQNGARDEFFLEDDEVRQRLGIQIAVQHGLAVGPGEGRHEEIVQPDRVGAGPRKLLPEDRVDHRQVTDDRTHGESIAQVAPLASVRIAVELGHMGRPHHLPKWDQGLVVRPLIRVAPGRLIGLHPGDDHMTLSPEAQLINGPQASVSLEVVELLQAIALRRQAETGVIGH